MTNMERECPVCKGRSYAPFAEQRIDASKFGALTYASRKPPEFMRFRLVRCLACDLVYTPSPPSEDFLHTAYKDAEFDSSDEAIAAAKNYALALEPHLQTMTNRNAAVDVGAGSGPLLPFLQEKNFYPVIGIEPSKAAIDAAAPAVRPLLKEGMFSTSMLDGEHPSLICSFMTLEHIRDPGVFCTAAHGELEPGGALAVVAHNWRAPLNRILGLRSPIIDVEHLQLFSQKALSELFRRAGFESIEISPIHNSYPLRYWLRLTPLPVAAKKWLLLLFERLGLADHTFTMNVGNILAVGTKRA